MTVTNPANPLATPVSRRRLLALGGLSAAAAVIVAACGEDLSGSPTRVGQAPSGTDLPTATINDVVRLRTAASVSQSLVDVYDQVIGKPELLDASNDEMAKRLRDEHAAHVTALGALTTAAGGTAWTCANPRLAATITGPAMARITTGDPTKKIPASDDPKRDVLNLLYGLESLAAATCQEMVGTLNTVDLRGKVVAVALNASRHAALLALHANTARPGGYVSAADATNAGVPLPVSSTTTVAPAGPPLTEIPVVTAIPSQFGLLGAQLLVVGGGDENGVRFKTNMETPHDNSLVYEYLTPAC